MRGTAYAVITITHVPTPDSICMWEPVGKLPDCPRCGNDELWINSVSGDCSCYVCGPIVGKLSDVASDAVIRRVVQR